MLPEVLRRWFGPEAGVPGTAHEVEFRPDSEGAYRLAAVGSEDTTPEARVGEHYTREEIPPFDPKGTP